MFDFIMRVALMFYMFDALARSIFKADVGGLIWAIILWTAYMYFFPVFKKKQIKE